MPHTITPIQATDSTAAVIDSSQMLVVPAYSDGFAPAPQHVAAAPTVAVVEVPGGNAAQPVAVSALHSTGVMALLLAAVMAVVVSYRSGYKYIEDFVHHMFSTRRRENLFDDHTVDETQILTALIAHSCVMQGFLLMVGVTQLVPALRAGVMGSLTLHVALGAAIVAVYYLLQQLAYRVVGYVFADAVATRLWIDGFNASQSLLGLTLLPVVGLMLLHPAMATPLLIAAAVLYAMARLVFICKGFRIFYSNLPSIVYFILYLCSVEIVPLVILCTGTIYLCKLV